MFAFPLEKAIKISDNIAFIIPKALLYVKQFKHNRKQLRNSIYKIVDYGKEAFDVNLETVSFLWSKTDRNKFIVIESNINNTKTKKERDYIFDKKNPIWLIYKDKQFDKTLEK